MVWESEFPKGNGPKTAAHCRLSGAGRDYGTNFAKETQKSEWQAETNPNNNPCPVNFIKPAHVS